MRLTHWAAAPLASPPPIPLTTDAVSEHNLAYRVGAIPVEALAADLIAAGLTYAEGRGNGYARNGKPVDPYIVGELIADMFSDSASILDYVLETDPVLTQLTADRERLAGVSYGARHGERAEECAALSLRIEDTARALPTSDVELALVARSLHATARLIRGFPSSRSEAVRRFRSAIPRPECLAGPSLSVDEFLASVPPGPIARPDLHAAALAAGVAGGSRTLYAAADALGWPLATRRGVRRYRVPALP